MRINESFLRKLYERADDISRDAIREEYPEIDFNAKEVFAFEKSQTLDTTPGTVGNDWAIMVANGLAPDNLELKCLVVNNAYVPEIFEHGGHRLIKFTRK